MKGKGGFLEGKIEREGQLHRKRKRDWEGEIEREREWKKEGELISAEILAQFNFLTDLARETGHEREREGEITEILVFYLVIVVVI